jgi:hypothetical protein
MDDERPPERIWLDDEALSSHWEFIENKRHHRSTGMEEVPQFAGAMDQNELTAGFKR